MFQKQELLQLKMTDILEMCENVNVRSEVETLFSDYPNQLDENQAYLRKMSEKGPITFSVVKEAPSFYYLRQRLENENKKLRHNFVGEGIFECRKCKSKKTSYNEKQVRSADEPMTVFVKCHNCGNKWKQ